MKLKSAAFGYEEALPVKYTGERENISPPFEWDDVPGDTKEFVLICDDPDAPQEEPWVHWVLYKIPSHVSSLEEDESTIGLMGENSFGNMKYGGPMPPEGDPPHHYHFRLYALDTTLELDPGATKSDVMDAMKEHVLDSAEYIGTFRR